MIINRKVFNVSLFDDIKNKFGNTYYENFKETIYAAFKGDVATIDNLKKIVSDSIETKDEYMSALNGRPLLYRLNELGNILFLFLNNDSVFGNDGLIKIRDKQDYFLNIYKCCLLIVVYVVYQMPFSMLNCLG